jgi:hypothetical protein
MKLHNTRPLLLALNLAAAFLPRAALAAQGEGQTITKSVSVTEAYACSLNVWNRETRVGEQDQKLTEFRIVLRADYLGSSLREGKREPERAAARGRFRVKQLELKYFKDWPGPQSQLAAQEVSESVDWSKLKIRANAETAEELPLLQFPRDSALAQVVLHSTLAMARNDLMRIGQFEFVATQAGVYELHFQLWRKRRVTFEAREVIEFRCPEERPQLAVVKAGVLHQMRIPYIHIPLVASTFFETGSELWNQNPTDRIFRSVFWGLAAKRLACSSLGAQLLLLDDPTAESSPPARLELANRRAQTLLRLVREKAALFHSNTPCENMARARNDETNGRAQAIPCTTGITIETPWPGQSQVFIKSIGSEVSPKWFAEENRVVPLVASIAAQRTVFQPLKLKPLEDSDDVELRCEKALPPSLSGCVRFAEIEIANEQGEKQKQKISWKDLQAASQNGRPMRLDSQAMREFLRPGKYRARLLLHTSFVDSVLAGAAAEFTIERRNIVRDEVFALAPYDRADLIYALDHERIADLSREILRTVRDSLTANASELFVLITGHSDSLGEHRAKGVGRDYNLSLSFARAVYLRRLLGDSLFAHAAQINLAASASAELLFIPPALRESVGKNVNNPAILEVFKRPNCSGAGPACTEETLQSHLEMLITEKVRHFKAGLVQESAKHAGVPTAAEVRNNIAALRALLPMEVATFEFSPGGQTRYVHLVSTGFGAAVPFYRRLEVSEELQEVFCRMGFGPQETPGFFFGKDAHPSGRLMNRRVELNMVW